MPGQTVGEYVVEALIGQGGFGTVYRAAHPVIGKQVAIKVLAWKLAADETMVSRFAAEARAVNQIRHRNIIDIFSFNRLPDGRHYYVMEYLEGQPLDRFLDQRGALPLDEVLAILRPVGRALDAAHAKGIAHRDLKPENIFLANDPDGGVFPKLLDFGIAKLLDPDRGAEHRTETGVPIGTPAYMSPEQCRGRAVDHRTDIYSFGILAYRMLTGRLPFASTEYMELLLSHMQEEPPPPSTHVPALTGDVDAVILAMLRKDPYARPATLSAAIAAFDPDRRTTPFASPLAPVTHPSEAATPVGAVTAPRPPRRSRALAMILGVATISVAVGVFAAVKASRDGAPPATTTAVASGEGSSPAPVVADAAAPAATVEVDAAAAPPVITEREIQLAGIPRGADVRLDDRAVEGSTLRLPLDGKQHVLSIRANGFETYSQTLDERTPDTLSPKLRRKKPAQTGPRPLEL